MNTSHIYFDEEGDPSLGYDIVQWDVSESKQGAQINTIGEYRPNGTIIVPEHLYNTMRAVKVRFIFTFSLFARMIFEYHVLIRLCLSKVTAYNCSKTCEPGRQLTTGNKKCCMICVKCETNYVSPANGKCFLPY